MKWIERLCLVTALAAGALVVCVTAEDAMEPERGASGSVWTSITGA